MVDNEFQRKWKCGNLENLTAVNSLLRQWGSDAKLFWKSQGTGMFTDAFAHMGNLRRRDSRGLT
eukprot:6356671-Karenia_brevis.AAC.1